MRRRYLLLIVLVVLFCLNACKKDNTTPQSSGTLILGKWLVTSHTSVVHLKGVLVDSATRTAFTTDDYIQYFNDGTGVLSSEASPSPSLVIFNYTISGLKLVQFGLNGTAGIQETIVSLTPNNLSFHYALTITDPDSGNVYDETDDYSFKR